MRMLILLMMASAASQAQTLNDSLVTVATGLSTITFIEADPTTSNRLLVGNQQGTISIVNPGDGSVQASPFIDLSGIIATGSERGLLGMAFDPDYGNNRYFYLYYSAPANYDPPGSACGVPTSTDFGAGFSSQAIDHQSVISRFQAQAGNPNQADPASEVCLLNFAQPFGNHNGGQLAFGPDGKLYVASGDGGSAGDPLNAGQRNDTVLGKILRLDPALPAPHIPADNPLAGQSGMREEIWATGLRNPWRFSFDPLTGDLYIADVGQNAWEEVNVQPAGSTGGENYGWDCYEGNAIYATNTPCLPDPVTPILDYDHSNNRCSITGGYVYRGSEYPWMQGHYFYADLCSGELWTVKNENGSWNVRLRITGASGITTFGTDGAGNLYTGDWGGVLKKYVSGDRTFFDGFESP